MIIQIVEQIVNQLSVTATIDGDTNQLKFGFGHGAQYFANLQNDEFDFGDFDGIVYLDQPITTEYQLTAGGYIGEFYAITLFFMMKSDLEWLPAEHDEKCIGPANLAIRQFISLCQDRNDLIDEVDNATALEFINMLDVNVSGKSLNINLKIKVNASVCTPANPAP